MKKVRVTLLNPNRYKYPPVIPLGLEYLAAALEENKYDVNVLDLCFSKDIYKDINSHFDVHDTDVVGVTIRNIDPSIYGNDECFLDEISYIADYIKTRYSKPVILGGAGFSIMPKEILRYVGGDYGVCGYGEKAFIKLLNDINNSDADYDIIDGYKCGIDRNYKKKILFNYDIYFDNGGIAGFETQKGCNGTCIFCYESGKNVIHRDIGTIIEEIKSVSDMGYNKFHLCDSEFNQDTDFCEAFLKELIKSGVDISWALYMKPVPYTREMFSLLKKSGAELITLSVDSYQCMNSDGAYSFNNLKDIIEFSDEFGIKIAIDLLVGFPNESLDSIQKVIDFFKKNRPDTIGVSYAIRLYPGDRIKEIILKDDNLRQYLTCDPGDWYIKPLYYKYLTPKIITDMTAEDELFRVEKGDKMVNYERI